MVTYEAVFKNYADTQEVEVKITAENIQEILEKEIIEITVEDTKVNPAVIAEIDIVVNPVEINDHYKREFEKEFEPDFAVDASCKQQFLFLFNFFVNKYSFLVTKSSTK